MPTMYVEPFVGGAAVFLKSAWINSTIGDLNPALAECYRGLAEDAKSVRLGLTDLAVNRETYQKISAWLPKTPTDAAVRLIYLNRVAYGGIYRVNRKGRFNVPFAGDRTLDTVLKGERLERAGAAFSAANIICGDFGLLLENAGQGALVYCDPPYSLPGGETTFRRYSQSPFGWSDQVRLAKQVNRIASEGASVIVSNSFDEQVRDLYPYARVIPIARTSSLGSSRIHEHKEAVYVLHADGRMADLIADCLSRGLRTT